MSQKKTVNISDVEVSVKPVKPRNLKKTIIITLGAILVVCSLCGWGAFAGYFYIDKNYPDVLYFLKIKDKPEVVTNNSDNEPSKNDDPKTDTEIPSDLPKVKEYSIEESKSIFGLKFTYLDAPEKVASFNIIAPCVSLACGDYVSSDFEFYKVGTVTSGLVKGVDLKGFDNIVAVNTKQSNGGYIPYVRLFIKADRTAGIIPDTNIAYQMIGFEWVPALKDASDSWMMNPSEFGLMNFEKPVYMPSPTYSGALDVSNIFYSGAKTKYYRAVSFKPVLFKDLGATTAVDNIGESQVYLAEDGSNYIKSFDGFAYRFVYYPDFLEPDDMLDYEIIPNITWKNGTKNVSLYDFYNVGKCGTLSGASLEIATLTVQNDLVESGKAPNGSPVYFNKNTNADYLKKIYNEDYKAMSLNKYNETKEDDVVPFTYAQFLTKNPVFYYIDSFGRTIRFVSREFVFTGGCAKPAVYIYGQAGEKVNVNVSPTGEFRFTLPEYDSTAQALGGWRVTLNSDGTLHDAKGGTYDYLWYESTAGYINTPNVWVRVNADNYDNFLNNYLVKAGLSDKEKQDFMEYWQPEFAKAFSANSEDLYVSFLVDDKVNQIAGLKVTTDSDVSTLVKTRRIFMLVSDVLPENSEVSKSLQIAKFDRSVNKNELVVVEWGGGWK
jgi:hypothetical protein